MNISKKDLGKSQIELTVEISAEEFKPYVGRGAQKVSEQVKIQGFRPGKAHYDVLKNTVGEMTILEEAAHLVIDKTVGKAVKENVSEQIVGQPQANVTKLAPGNPLEYKIIIPLLPEVKLGRYKNLQIKEKQVEAADEETEKLIGQLRQTRAREVISDKEIKDGDRVIADIEIFLDKVPVEGGQE